MFVWKSPSIVGRATLIAEKSLAIVTVATPIANSASQLIPFLALPSTGRQARASPRRCATLSVGNGLSAEQPRASPSPPPSGGIALGGAIAARDIRQFQT